jgi:sugar lactone lactonase YvrE
VKHDPRWQGGRPALVACLLAVLFLIPPAAPAHGAGGAGPVGWPSTVLAGTGTAGYTGDGAAGVGAALDAPAGLAVDSRGRVYIVDSDNAAIRRVGTDGAIGTFASTDFTPYGVAVGADGTVYVSGDGNVVSITPDARKTTTLLDGPGAYYDVAVGAGREVYAAAGTRGLKSIAGDGAISTLLPSGVNVTTVAVDSSGRLCAAGDGKVYRLAGGSVRAIVPGVLPRQDMYGLTALADGTFYFTSPVAKKVFRLASDGTYTVLADSTNGLAGPWGTALGPDGRLYVSDFAGNRVYAGPKPALQPDDPRLAGIGVSFDLDLDPPLLFAIGAFLIALGGLIVLRVHR